MIYWRKGELSWGRHSVVLQLLLHIGLSDTKEWFLCLLQLSKDGHISESYKSYFLIFKDLRFFYSNLFVSQVVKSSIRQWNLYFVSDAHSVHIWRHFSEGIDFDKQLKWVSLHISSWDRRILSLLDFSIYFSTRLAKNYVRVRCYPMLSPTLFHPLGRSNVKILVSWVITLTSRRVAWKTLIPPSLFLFNKTPISKTKKLTHNDITSREFSLENWSRATHFYCSEISQPIF